MLAEIEHIKVERRKVSQEESGGSQHKFAALTFI